MNLYNLYEEVLKEDCEKISLVSKSKKGNRYFKMLKDAQWQHYDAPKGDLTDYVSGEDDRKRLVTNLSKADKKLYREWLKTPEGETSVKLFADKQTKFKERTKGWGEGPISESTDRMIDVSCAALGSIKIDGKYLLFKEKMKYQPIGGGLKFKPSAIPFLESINYRTARTDNDIRIQIPESKWEIFKQWFQSGKDREISIDREMEEELGSFLDSSYLSQMNTSNYQLKEVIEGKHRIFQIHQITFSDEVRNAILELVHHKQLFILATPEEMKSSDEISSHSHNIIL